MKKLRDPDTAIYTAIQKYIHKAEENLSENSARERKRALRDNFPRIVEQYSIERVEEIHTDLVEEYVDMRREDGVTDMTIKGEVNYIRGLCNHYNHTDFLAIYSFSDLNLSTDSVVEKSTEEKGISKEGYKKVLQEAETLRDELIVRLGWDTGARRKEIAKIDLEDIEYDEIELNTAKRDSTNKHQTKRTVYLSIETAEKLRRYIEFERDSYGGAGSTDALLVTQRGRIHPHSLNRVFTKLCEKAGVQKKLGTNAKGQEMNLYTYHSLRHAFAVQRLDEGMQLKYIADLMGDTVQSVSDTYLQTSQEQLRQAEEKYRPNVRI